MLAQLEITEVGSGISSAESCVRSVCRSMSGQECERVDSSSSSGMETDDVVE